MTTLAILQPGSMGAAVAEQANAESILWCPAGRSDRTRNRAHNAGLIAVDDLHDLLTRADVILSICPPGKAAQDTAELVAAGRYRGLFVDANAISPPRMTRIADHLRAAGARVIDACIIGHPPGPLTQSTLYLAGDPEDLTVVTGIFQDSQLTPTPLPGPIGTASGFKCAFSTYQKTAHTLAALAHALAAHHQVDAELLAEAIDRAPGSPLSQPQRLAQGAAKAWRWEPEFGEIADALNDAHLPPDTAHAASQVISRWAAFKDNTATTVPTVLDRLRDP
jgi:3-hydroxyisobutyrate dehydrogenase-like beta-hydroxyacid dehydrogenase